MTIKECYDKGHMQFKCRHTGLVYTIVCFDKETNMFCYKNTKHLFTADVNYRVEPIATLVIKEEELFI